MALPTDLNFSIKFDLGNDPSNFELKDTTDYDTLGISTSDVRGNFIAVTDPVGNIIHNNTDFTNPDIVPSNSLLYNGIDIPTDTDGDIIEGTYSFTYNIIVDVPILALLQSAPGPYFSVFGDKVAEILAAGVITVVRSTGNNGVYPVLNVNISGPQTIITVASIPSGVIDGSIQYSTQPVYTKTKTAVYSNLIPVIDIDVQTDCFCGVLKSIDRTNYGTATITNRIHTVKYPAALAIADIISSNAIITVSPIYTKTWVTIIETTFDINIGNGNTISATITGSKETKVECDLTLCDISCCVLALNNRYLDARCENPPLADKYFKDLTRMMQLIDMFSMFSSCSQNEEAADALAEIKKVGNCSDSCMCTDDTPAIVIPLCTSGGTSNVNVIQDTGIIVTTSFVNGTYTYQVSLTPSIINTINSLHPQNVLGGAGISVTESMIGGVETWVVTNTAPYIAQNRFDFLTRIQYTSPTSVTITSSDFLTSGSNMNTTANVASTTILSAGSNNNFRVSGFQIAPNNNYKVTTELVIVNHGGAVYTYNSTRQFTLEVINKLSGQFDFRFVNSYNSNITNLVMFETADVYVNIKISE